MTYSEPQQYTSCYFAARFMANWSNVYVEAGAEVLAYGDEKRAEDKFLLEHCKQMKKINRWATSCYEALRGHSGEVRAKRVYEKFANEMNAFLINGESDKRVATKKQMIAMQVAAVLIRDACNTAKVYAKGTNWAFLKRTVNTMSERIDTRYPESEGLYDDWMGLYEPMEREYLS